MTIRHRETFARKPAAGFDGVFDWDWLSDVFGGRIEPMDLDALVEIRGRFLIFETKDPGVPIPAGQRIALEALARLPAFTVVILWGKTVGEVCGVEIWRRGRQRRYGRSEGSPNPDVVQRLRTFCRSWAIWARGGELISSAKIPIGKLMAEDIRW